VYNNCRQKLNKNLKALMQITLSQLWLSLSKIDPSVPKIEISSEET
jgi:hypothetical protein